MRSLLDVNVLLALTTESHALHVLAMAWSRSHGEKGWASCPLTQNGFVRIACQLPLPAKRTMAEAVRQLQLQLAAPGHEFWPDGIMFPDDLIFDHSQLTGHKQIADVYLLALAVRHSGRLVTFDRGIPLKAVRGATAANLVVI